MKGSNNMENKVYITDESANFTTIRDPMVMLVGDTYYVTGTQPPYWKGINDGVRLLSSKDLKTFTDHGLVIKREDMPEDMWCRDRFWAPEIFDGKNGWFYLTFNCRNEDERYAYGHSVGVARARKPEGPYEIVTKEKALHHGNDATIFLDDDGKAYIGFTCADKLVLYRFDLDTCEISEEQVVCYKGNEGEWDSIGVEGQCIVKRHGIYFQWYSSWTNGYAAGVLTCALYALCNRTAVKRIVATCIRVGTLVNYIVAVSYKLFFNLFFKRVTIALTIQTFVGKVMSLHSNTVSRFVIVFFPRSKCLFISWL